MNRFILIFFTCAFTQQADHLLLNQVVTQPSEAESFSIYNPTDSPIELIDYYVCDDENYYKMQTEGDISPSSSLSGFTAKFPNISIEAGDTLTIVLHDNYRDYFGEDFYADLVMFGTSDSSLTGSIGSGNNKIEESSELIILFQWDGTNKIKDIDYLLWGAYQTPINKTGISTYNNDTSGENQLYFDEEAQEYYAYSRIGTDEIGETDVGGNGISGHDETSENFRQSWEIIELFNLGCTWADGINYDPNAKVDDGSCYVITISEILTTSVIGQPITTAGVISDYFDVTPFNGPHSITIAEESSGSTLELTIWPSDWTNELAQLVEPPFFTKEIKITGEVRKYEGVIQISPTSYQILNQNYEFQAPAVSIDSIIYGNYDNKVISCKGLLVDYFDITVYNGPHALTIENEQGYRLELSIWPNTYDIANSPFSYLLQPPYNRYYLSVMGSVGEYENEKQLSISGESSITVSDTINTDGIKYNGLMVTFIIDKSYDNFNENFKTQLITDLASQLAVSQNRISIVNVRNGSVIIDVNIIERSNEDEPSNDDLIGMISAITQVGDLEVEIQEILELSVNTTIIKPDPYVLIPTLGEKLDYRYSFPEHSRVIIRVFDLSGRFITSLVDKYYDESSTVFRDDNQSSWNGRDHLGQIVPPGTYIMHIEAMNPISGETQTNSAPVVVGVKN